MLHNKKIPHFIPQLVVSLATVVLGNTFWFLLYKAINGSHLLTNSVVAIILAVLYPIIVFSFYLSLCALLSIFISNRVIQFLILVLSLADYVMVTGGDYIDFIGEIAISIALFIFLFLFQRTVVLTNGKKSITSRVTSAFSKVDPSVNTIKR